MIDSSSIGGESGPTPTTWPIPGDRPPEESTPILLMFLHPHCSCSQSSLSELERILARCPIQPEVRLYFVKPAGVSGDWCRTRIHRMAGKMSGVSVAEDPEGRLADLFGARTSGHVVLYDGQGQLRYSGGITPARAHEGTTAAHTVIRNTLSGTDSHSLFFGPVFGCELGTCCQSDQSRTIQEEQHAIP